ncbi:hypothetical protein LTSEUGA_3811, partial [Salmonella enterica subsp. enterica serovar Uganda str. R8-3404]
MSDRAVGSTSLARRALRHRAYSVATTRRAV